ncbi:putative fibrinogen C domain-containing protein 1 [Apostichopus japonicus]|uniref:Putative fibrinogen C domain-containing protein 1 n=1 Tax=Stichopus japonicus TaxID=307972 RepID=A0A2G8JZL4_STIJA|nr:putative fibrinogen C domain-containing protein 1 [Apostichopus japonicus]
MEYRQKVIVRAEGRSSGSSYFVFQQPEYPRDCKEVLNSCSSTYNTSAVYLIKPDGYPEPFEAYCDNDLDTGGWTVLQRRRLDSVNFNRSWKDFRNGFGFQRSEFWIGNEKIAYLTNQKRYQLRMDFENIDGDTYYVTYDDFRISDEWGKYYISSLGRFVISDESKIEWCPENEIFSNETCERTCDDPNTCISATSRKETEQCVCVGDYLRHQEQCIPLNQCNCFVDEKGSVLPVGDFYVNSRCTRKSTCRNNQIIEASYQCSDHATCAVRSGVRNCYCNPNYQGDGETCTHNCFVAGLGSVLGVGDFYVNSRCTRKSTCRNNQIIEASYQCSDHATCAVRNGVRNCYCNPNYQGDGETCTHNCFVADLGSVLGVGDFYVNSRCTRKSTCRNNQIIEASYQCSSHASCAERSGVRKCYCNPNYEGDGVTCTLIPKDCYDLYVSGTRSDGVYTIYPDDWPSGIQVYCEMESNGGGWTVFQRRSSASVDFYRGWSDYKNGFGNKNHDHWLGNKYIHSLTNQKTYQLRIDLRDSASSSYYSVHPDFSINNEADKYRLSIGSSYGNTGE